MFLTGSTRFDGRTIRVDKASDTGPKGGFGGRGGGFGGRGGYGQPQMPYAGGQPGAYGIPPNPSMYAPAYGRGGYPVQQPYGAPPPQGKDQFSTLH